MEERLSSDGQRFNLRHAGEMNAALKPADYISFASTFTASTFFGK